MFPLDFKALLRLVALVSATLFPLISTAIPLEMTISNPTVSAAAGSTLTFTGVITNRTGQSLETTDLFLNFVGYDPDTLTPNQLLGFDPLTLPDFTFSPDIDLFAVDVSPHANPGTYEFQVLLQDIAGNFSEVSNIGILITGDTVNLPEPSTFMLALIGIALGAFVNQGSKKRSNAIG